MNLNDVLALRRGIHGFPALGSDQFRPPFVISWGVMKPGLFTSSPIGVQWYIPGWCAIIWPTAESGFPQWVLDTQPKAEAKAVADAAATAALEYGVTSFSKYLEKGFLTPGGILVSPLPGIFTGPEPKSTGGFPKTIDKALTAFYKYSGSAMVKMLKPDGWTRPSYESFARNLPWRISVALDREVLDRIVPRNPADPLAAYMRLVTIPYLPALPLAGWTGVESGEFFTTCRSYLNQRARVDYADAAADVMGRSWDYDRPAQDAQLAIIDTAFNTLRDAIDHGTEKDAAFAYWAAGKAAENIWKLEPKSVGEVTSSGSAWTDIAKGTLTVAAATVSIVAGGVIAAPIVAAGLLIKDAAEKKAEAAIDNQIDQAINDTLALKKEAEAWEQAAAAVVPDTYVLMVEQTEVGTYGKLEDASAATITMTTPGDRFEVFLNGKSLGIRVRTSTGSMAVPDDIGVQIYSIARDQMTQFVGQAETEVAKSGGIPWWLIGGGAAAAVASQFL